MCVLLLTTDTDAARFEYFPFLPLASNIVITKQTCNDDSNNFKPESFGVATSASSYAIIIVLNIWVILTVFLKSNISMKLASRCHLSQRTLQNIYSESSMNNVYLSYNFRLELLARRYNWIIA